MNAVARPHDTVVSAVEAANLSFASAQFAHERLKGWLMSAESIGLAEAQVENEVAERGREIQRLMLQAHFHARGTGDVGPALRVVHPPAADQAGAEAPATPEPVLHADKHICPRILKTIVGEISVPRTAYMADGRAGIHPLDESAQLPARSFSYPLQRKLVLNAVQGPFDEAIAGVKESTGVTVHKRSAEQVVADASVDFDPFYEQKPAPTENTGPILVAEADGKGVPMVRPEETLRVVRRGKGEKANKKRMATVAAVFTQQPRVRTPEAVTESLFRDRLRPAADEDSAPPPQPGPEHKRIWASLTKSKEAVLADLAAEAARRDPHRTKTLVQLSDGDPTLQRGISKALTAVFGEMVVIISILDLQHALERLWKVAFCFFPEGGADEKQIRKEREAWVRVRVLRMLQGKVGQVVKGIRQSATKRGLSGEKLKAIRTATDYLYKNRGRMRYHEYLRAGLPIASGSVEGACKNLVKDRMERSGMRWGLDGAEAMLKMRALYKSGDFEEYWKFHIGREQKRLHPERWMLGDEK